ncbi:MAG TPA: transcriptional repressor [Ktedonobacteraceae bacterium]|nr:transcriptional repressor [Ktedonobacteraceae bacterium]
MKAMTKTQLNRNAQAVLEVVQAAHNHPTAQEIYEAVKLVRPKIGLASVYRILHALSEQGYIKEVGRSDDCTGYDGRTFRHDHAICTNCGALLDVPVDVLVSAEALEQAALATGIKLGTYEVRLYGLCPSCAAKLNE